MTNAGAAAVVTVLLVLTLQWWVGAFASERGLHSDEAAHFMNGLVLRDYLREGLGQSPLEFAREYYRHYPKIAPFMWPPLFHGVLGIVLLPGWPPMAAAIVLIGLFSAWITWRLYRVVLSFASAPVALGVAAFFITTPIVIDLSSSVMIDIVVAAFAMEAAYWLGRFAGSGATSHAAVFGAMTALACVAKGNGLSAVLAPVVLIAMTGRLELLRRPGLYVAAGIVILVAAPPLYLAYRLDAGLGDFGPVTWPVIAERLVFYSRHIWHQLGALPVVFAAIGALVALGRPREWMAQGTKHQAEALAAMVGGSFGFHLLNPHILSHERYITLALAPILGLAALGVMAVTQGIPARAVRWSTQLAVFLAMALTHGAGQQALAAQPPLGYRDTITFLADAGTLSGRRILVVSNEMGEGACVSEAAALGLSPRPMVLRGSKVLASDDWMGRDLQLRYATPDALLTDLEAMHVDYVIIDDAPEAQRLPYWAQVREAFAAAPSRVELVRQAPASPQAGPLRPLTLYRLTTRAPGAPKPIEFSGSSPFIGAAP